MPSQSWKFINDHDTGGPVIKHQLQSNERKYLEIILSLYVAGY